MQARISAFHTGNLPVIGQCLRRTGIEHMVLMVSRSGNAPDLADVQADGPQGYARMLG
ncbi:hypothetical protein [Aurantiacibacter gilvus]|uniref:Uncharacterized protein n=1 Tax=Aurantiacibacter gilvus TaxID=3139141 RepID=A0ABU9IC15_9SPHN